MNGAHCFLVSVPIFCSSLETRPYSRCDVIPAPPFVGQIKMAAGVGSGFETNFVQCTLLFFILVQTASVIKATL